MTVRFAARYIEESVVRTIRGFMEEYGWLGPDVPFGAQPFTVLPRTINESDLKPVVPNQVFISLGTERSSRSIQLGGGVMRNYTPVFVDVLAEDHGVGVSVAGDIKDRLEGIYGGTRYLRPINPATGAQLPGYLGEFQDVEREQPRPSLMSWHAVKAVLQMDFPGDDS